MEEIVLSKYQGEVFTRRESRMTSKGKYEAVLCDYMFNRREETEKGQVYVYRLIIIKESK